MDKNVLFDWLSTSIYDCLAWHNLEWDVSQLWTVNSVNLKIKNFHQNVDFTFNFLSNMLKCTSLSYQNRLNFRLNLSPAPSTSNVERQKRQSSCKREKWFNQTFVLEKLADISPTFCTNVCVSMWQHWNSGVKMNITFKFEISIRLGSEPRLCRCRSGVSCDGAGLGAWKNLKKLATSL